VSALINVLMDIITGSNPVLTTKINKNKKDEKIFN
jgi:hypothetical protein